MGGMDRDWGSQEEGCEERKGNRDRDRRDQNLKAMRDN